MWVKILHRPATVWNIPNWDELGLKTYDPNFLPSWAPTNHPYRFSWHIKLFIPKIRKKKVYTKCFTISKHLIPLSLVQLVSQLLCPLAKGKRTKLLTKCLPFKWDYIPLSLIELALTYQFCCPAPFLPTGVWDISKIWQITVLI